ncbi:MAG TPA: response regulator [Candidatus Sulfotelmatobacter sp.]|nr:response regulator [Candidatus Sulfotelmatobacter sp.]
MNAGAASTPAPLVLVVEDDAPIRRFLRAALEANGYRLREALTGKEGLALAATDVPDLVLLDLGLPDIPGLEVVRRLREWSRVPIVVVSARGQEQDKILALDAGADDYVTKPFAMGELLARLRVAFRHRARGESDDEGMIESGELRVDLARRRVTIGDAEVRLTPIEYRLLAELARHAGRVLTHEHLLREVWGPSHVRDHHYLRVYTAQLRQKLEREPARPKLLITEPGVGYRLAMP